MTSFHHAFRLRAGNAMIEHIPFGIHFIIRNKIVSKSERETDFGKLHSVYFAVRRYSQCHVSHFDDHQLFSVRMNAQALGVFDII